MVTQSAVAVKDSKVGRKRVKAYAIGFCRVLKIFQNILRKLFEIPIGISFRIRQKRIGKAGFFP